MKLRLCQYLITAVMLISGSSAMFAHCEIPCGIYDDKMRIKMIDEDILTIKKSMEQIDDLGKIQKKNPKNENQLIRWVINKDNSADNIQKIVSQYFMTQRIKPDTDNYIKKISLLHLMLIYAMKCKQTINIDNLDYLNDLVKQFDTIYFKKK